MTASPEASSEHLARVRLRQGLVLALAGLMALVMVFLGVWQMSVYRTQGVRNLERRAAEPPVSLDAELARGQAVGTMYGHQVRLHGHYINQTPVLVGTRAPYRVVQPFQDGTRVVGIVRGTATGPAAALPAAPTGERDQVGVLMPSEGQGNAAQQQDARPGQVATVNLESLAQRWPDGVLPGFVTLSASDARAQNLSPATVTMPDNASGRAQNLGYAMQWWVFAIFAVVMGIVFARTIGRKARSGATASGRGTRRTPEAGRPHQPIGGGDAEPPTASASGADADSAAGEHRDDAASRAGGAGPGVHPPLGSLDE